MRLALRCIALCMLLITTLLLLDSPTVRGLWAFLRERQECQALLAVDGYVGIQARPNARAIWMACESHWR